MSGRQDAEEENPRHLNMTPIHAGREKYKQRKQEAGLGHGPQAHTRLRQQHPGGTGAVGQGHQRGNSAETTAGTRGGAAGAQGRAGRARIGPSGKPGASSGPPRRHRPGSANAPRGRGLSVGDRRGPRGPRGPVPPRRPPLTAHPALAPPRAGPCLRPPCCVPVALATAQAPAGRAAPRP